MSYEVKFTDSCIGSVKHLKKRYPSVTDDLKRSVKVLLADPKIGKVIPHDDGARKLRLANSSAKKGKSGGFRLIYYVQELPKPTLWLLLLYSKNEQEYVDSSELEKLVAAIKN